MEQQQGNREGADEAGTSRGDTGEELRNGSGTSPECAAQCSLCKGKKSAEALKEENRQLRAELLHADGIIEDLEAELGDLGAQLYRLKSSRLLPIDEPSAKANHQAEEKLRAELAEAVARCEWEAAQRGAAERQLTAFQRLLSKANEDLRVARQEKGGRGGAPEVQGTPQDEEGDAKAAAVAALQWLRSGWEAEEKAGTPSWAEAEVSLMRARLDAEASRHAAETLGLRRALREMGAELVAARRSCQLLERRNKILEASSRTQDPKEGDGGSPNGSNLTSSAEEGPPHDQWAAELFAAWEAEVRQELRRLEEEVKEAREVAARGLGDVRRGLEVQRRGLREVLRLRGDKMSKTPPWGLWGAATLEELTGQRKARLAAEKARDSVAGQLQEMLARLEDRELELRSAEEALEGLKESGDNAAVRQWWKHRELVDAVEAKARARATAEAAAADLGAEREAHATAPKELADAKDELEALRGAAAASAPPHAAGEAPAESNGNGVDADLESRSEEGRPSAEVEAVGSRGGGAGSFHATDGDLVDSGEALRPEEAACRCKLLAEEQERRARAEGLLEVATEERKELARELAAVMDELEAQRAQCGLQMRVLAEALAAEEDAVADIEGHRAVNNALKRRLRPPVIKFTSPAEGSVGRR